MKKVTSICLMILLMLNIMGYYGFFLGLEYKNARHLSQRIDSGFYHDGETITLKIPMAIPYYPNTDFERVEGEIEYNGGNYRLVRQKYYQDTLHIVCIRDHQGTVLKQALGSLQIPAVGFFRFCFYIRRGNDEVQPVVDANRNHRHHHVSFQCAHISVRSKIHSFPVVIP